ncbi:sce7725 family protein [Tenacibaculum sp. A30]|uniref:sce7725 family protein n=1 Tax=Tenacibaculum sp. A30 TaxID=3442644 RepID=UPI003EBEC0B7
MYYPYLRGRQFELIALREYAECKGENNNITPIIEPVKKTFNSLKLALPKLLKNNVNFALVLNPKVGDLEGTINEVYGEELQEMLSDFSKWIPTFIVENDYVFLKGYIEKSGFENVMIFCSETTDTNNTDFKALISLSNVVYVVSEDNRTLKTFVRSLGKKIIRLDDKFKGTVRNSDYLDMKEEKFTEEHYYYLDDNYDGFSDYTPLVSSFVVGGSAPYAVAIHITYAKAEQEIWIRHFTSFSNTGRANIQGKFAEAAKKAVDFLNEKGIHTHASDELRAYYSEAKYPGLGMSKKITIKHHLEVINKNIRL